MAKFEILHDETEEVPTLTLSVDEKRRIDDMSNELTGAHYTGGRPRERCDEQWAIFMRELLGKTIWNQICGHEDVRTVVEGERVGLLDEEDLSSSDRT